MCMCNAGGVSLTHDGHTKGHAEDSMGGRRLRLSASGTGQLGGAASAY